VATSKYTYVSIRYTKEAMFYGREVTVTNDSLLMYVTDKNVTVANDSLLIYLTDKNVTITNFPDSTLVYLTDKNVTVSNFPDSTLVYLTDRNVTVGNDVLDVRAKDSVKVFLENKDVTVTNLPDSTLVYTTDKNVTVTNFPSEVTVNNLYTLKSVYDTTVFFYAGIHNIDSSGWEESEEWLYDLEDTLSRFLGNFQSLINAGFTYWYQIELRTTDTIQVCFNANEPYHQTGTVIVYPTGDKIPNETYTSIKFNLQTDVFDNVYWKHYGSIESQITRVRWKVWGY
jgi:hypothetical protein